MDRMQQRTDKHEERLDTLETRVADTEDSQTTTHSNLLKMDEVLNIIRQKNEDLEARSRWNNVRITGIPESTAITNMEQYVETMMKDLFDPDLSSMFLIERAHRTLGPKPPPGAKPRPIIARVLNYRDRDMILRKARERGELQYQSNGLAIYPDFTAHVQAARREFLPAKQIFQKLGTKYTLIYPAKLKVQGPGKPAYFTDAKAALAYAKQLSKEQKHNKKTAEQHANLSDND